MIDGSVYPCLDIVNSVNTCLERLRPEVVDDVMYHNTARFFGLFKSFNLVITAFTLFSV